jgi:hypothetical protein
LATYDNNKVWVHSDSKDDNPQRVQDILHNNNEVWIQTDSKQFEIPQQVQFRRRRGMGCSFSAQHAVPEKDSMDVQDSVKCA